MIELIAITSLALYASGVAQMEGMVLHGLRAWIDKQHLPSFIAKPLYSCPVCMASIWGSIVWFFSADVFFTFDWPLFCFATSGLVYILIYNFPYDDQ